MEGVQLFFTLIQNLVSLSLVYISLLLWDVRRKKQTACRKQRFNHLGQQMMVTARNMGTAASSILPIAWRHTTIFAWFTPSLMHSHMVTSYRFFGDPISLHGLVHFLNTTGPSVTKVVYACFDRISYIYIYI